MDAATEARLVAELDQLRAGQAEILAILKGGGPRKAPAAQKTRKVSVAEFCSRQGCSRQTFARRFAGVFTVCRDAGSRPKLLADEVELYFAESPDGVSAVANYRRRLGRL